MRPIKTKKSLTLDQDLVYIIEDLSERDERSFSQYVNRILRLHAKEQALSSPHEELCPFLFRNHN